MAIPRKDVTPETVAEMAAIAGLKVDAGRAAELAPLLRALREGIEALDELDLGDIEPAAISPVELE